MGKIKNIPINERPREKAKKYGIATLSNAELLAILILCGTVGSSALEIANNLLDKGGLINLSSLSYEELIDFKGISSAKAITLLAVFELNKRIEHLKVEQKRKISSSEDVYLMLKSKFNNLNQEEVLILILSTSNIVIKEVVVAKGSFDSVNLDFRVLISLLLKANATKFILIHNHPFGNAKPSKEDIVMTNMIKKKTKEFSIRLLDHIIFGNQEYFSFKDQALIWHFSTLDYGLI